MLNKKYKNELMLKIKTKYKERDNMKKLLLLAVASLSMGGLLFAGNKGPGIICEKTSECKPKFSCKKTIRAVPGHEKEKNLKTCQKNI